MLNICNRIILSLNWLLGIIISFLLFFFVEYVVNKILLFVNFNNGVFYFLVIKGKYFFEIVLFLVIFFLY